MKVLGIHHGHDSSAAIVIDGKVIADAQEERFSRLKHSADFPFQAIQFCLEQANLESISEVDYIAWGGKNVSRSDSFILNRDPQPVHDDTLKSKARRILGKQKVPSHKKSLPVYFPDLLNSDEIEIIPVEHHLAHAASAYFTRKNSDPSLIFSIDGMGDGVCTSVWYGESNRITPLQKLGREAAIGWAYSIITEGLHWIHGDGEGKTMGLAPYGDSEKCRGKLDRFFPVFDGTELVRKTEPGEVDSWIFKSSHQWHLKGAKEVESLAEQYGAENIAAEAQRKLESIILPYISAWIEKTGIRNITFSGGLFLNVKLNQRIWELGHDVFDEQHIFPNPGDGGLAVGAALQVYHSEHGFNGSNFSHLYWGPGFSNDDIEKILINCKLPYRKCIDSPKEAAEILTDGGIIAWFQGRMESGPRALGNRSIIMSPLKPENKDIINDRVKYREAFRPFCPSLLWENRNDYLVGCRDEPFMITSFDVKERMKDKIPAVVHVDGTGRPQLVRREDNPKYWELINEFGKQSGHPIVLNTSFNIKGEPIICTPMDAIRCFYSNGLDTLFLGDFVIRK